MANTLRKPEMQDIEEIVGRALFDADFRGKLCSDPKNALSILGFEASAEAINFFKALSSNNFLTTANEVENRLGGRPVVAAWL